MSYYVCKIAGRQYLVQPGKIIEVNKLSDDKNLVVDKVMLMVDDGNVEIGHPYLNKTLEFEVLENVKKPKVRVATYHAKANYRRVKGMRPEVTRIRLIESKK